MTACAAPRHDGQEARAPEGSSLCCACLAQMRRDLRRLPGLHALLGAMLDPRRAGQARAGGAGLPFHEAASECASQIRHDLSACSAWVMREREPASCPVPGVAAMAAWLHGWSPWIAGRDWAGGMAGALAADRGRALALIDPMPCSVIPIPENVSWCPRCGVPGALWAVLWQREDDRRPCTVECAACGHAWGTTEWLRLGRDILRHVQRAAA